MSTYLSQGIETLAARARFASMAIVAALVVFGLTLVGELLEIAGVIDLEAYDLSPLALIYLVLLLANSVVFVGSVITVAMWIHRAHANLHESGIDGLSYTPGWAVGWFFIPFANLYFPFQAMRELWTESHNSGGGFTSAPPGNLGLWWGTWLIGNILANISFRLNMAADTGTSQIAVVLAAGSSVLSIVSAYLLLQIVRSITEAQTSHLSITEVFE